MARRKSKEELVLQGQRFVSGIFKSKRAHDEGRDKHLVISFAFDEVEALFGVDHAVEEFEGIFGVKSRQHGIDDFDDYENEYQIDFDLTTDQLVRGLVALMDQMSYSFDYTVEIAILHDADDDEIWRHRERVFGPVRG